LNRIQELDGSCQYGLEELGPWDEFEWGMDKRQAVGLRWVLGDGGDMLDT
jgi:hypothetical protein